LLFADTIYCSDCLVINLGQSVKCNSACTRFCTIPRELNDMTQMQMKNVAKRRS